MKIDLNALAAQVRVEVETYEVPERHPDLVGSALLPEWFEKGLAEMKAALVEPYWVEMRDYASVPGEVLTRQVAVVADEGHEILVAFDPAPDGDFVLTWRSPEQVEFYNVHGDAVGCFLAR